MENSSDSIYGRYEFVRVRSEIAVPCLIIISLASFIGTFGNILILTALVVYRKTWTIDAVFIGNLALSDMFVTLVADPMSIVAKLEGEEFFVQVPMLCQTIGSMCTISCVCSLLTIGGMALNRYFHICRYDLYRRLFTKRNVILMCCSFWTVGIVLVLINLTGVGDHSFDRKSLECIWDRMASYHYTVVFSVVMVWIPLFTISFSYILIYVHVINSKKRVHASTTSRMFAIANSTTGEKSGNGKTENHTTMKERDKMRSLRLAKTLFVIYAVFAVCWLPYALLVVVDSKDEFAHELHLIIVMTAHLHPSLNFIVYYVTNKKFRRTFQGIFQMCCRRQRGIESTVTSATDNGNTDRAQTTNTNIRNT